MTITKRAEKGSALTYDEMDENFRDLRYDTDLDRVLENGNTTTRNLTVGNIAYSSRTHVAGETVQQFYYRYDGIESFTTTANSSTSGCAVVDHNSFGRLILLSPFNTSITPKYSDSLIVIEFQIFGEPTSHNGGFLIGEDVAGLATVIRRPGYWGYNGLQPIDQQNTFVSDFYDGDNNSTLRLTRIMYFDKPETTNEQNYRLIYTTTEDNTNYTYRINRPANTSAGTVPQQSAYEVGVSTWSIKEIAQ